MNKFEQVSILGHEMSPAKEGDCWVGGNSCMVRSKASRVMVTWEPPLPHVNKQTRLKTLPSNTFIGGRNKD